MNAESDIRHIGGASGSELWSGTNLHKNEPPAGYGIISLKTPDTITVEGGPCTGARWRIPPAVLFVFLGCWVLHGVVTSTGKADDTTGLVFLLAVISIVIGFAIPGNAHTYLDLTRRELIRDSHYAGIQVSKRRLPFAGFQSIVVRHLVHDAEGESSYTGSVGFKPVGIGSVIWLKHFSTSADEISSEAHAYALDLHMLTGIPLPPPLTTP